MSAPATEAFVAPPAPRAVLRAAGVADDAVLGEAVLHDLSRSHHVTFAALPDGRAYVVKRVSPAAHAAGRSLAAELYAYRLAAWLPGLAAAVPEPVLVDERRQVLVLAAAPPQQLCAASGGQPGFPSAGLAAALGRTLAAVHVAARDVPVPAEASCGVVHLPDTPEEGRVIGDASPAALSVARVAAGDAVLAPVLRRGAAALRPDRLVHGDVKWDNAILDPGPPPRVRLFDWELSGRGDPAWDVASALADTVSLTVRLRGGAALPADPAGWISPALGALLAAYAAALRRAGEALEHGLAERIALLWAARTVHLALECAASVGAADAPVVAELLETARGLGGAMAGVTTAVGAALA